MTARKKPKEMEVLPKGWPNTTMKEARKILARSIMEGADCPCCGKYVKVYKRKLNSGMASVLLRFVRLHGQKYDPEKWVHIHDVFGGYGQDHRDWPLLRHWGLIEQRTGAENSSGYWRPTKNGLAFAFGDILVPAYVYLYTNTPTGFSDVFTDIRESLGDKLNYEELLGKGFFG